MIKLLKAYRAKPSDWNAAKLADYNDKHPMAKCFLSAEDFLDLKKAIKQVKDRK
jgi:hypothetical protein